MKKILFCTLFIVCLLEFSYGQIPEKRIAVLDYPTMKGISKSKAIEKTEALISELSKQENFVLLNRDEISKAIKATKFSLKKAIPENFQELGSILNAEYIIWSEIFQMYGESFEKHREMHKGSDTILYAKSKLIDQYLIKTYLVNAIDGSTKFLVKDTILDKNVDKITSSLSSKIIEKIAFEPKEVLVISNILYVYPEDIEKIEITLIDDICKDLNRKKMYGFDDWRAPIEEEMNMMQINRYSIRGMKCVYYLLNDRSNVFDFCKNNKITIMDNKDYNPYYSIWSHLTMEGKKIGYIHNLRPVRGGILGE